MGNFSKHRWVLVSIFHYIVLFLVNQLNFHLATQSIQITVLGTVIAFSALALSYGQGLLSLIPVAFFVDSASPLPFGTTLAIAATLHTGVWAMRSRLRRETSATSLICAITLTSILYPAYSAAATYSGLSPSFNFTLLLVNLACSWLVVILINSWFFAYQTNMLALFGVRLAEEQRESR